MSILELILEDDTAAGFLLIMLAAWGVAKFLGFDIPAMSLPI